MDEVARSRVVGASSIGNIDVAFDSKALAKFAGNVTTTVSHTTPDVTGFRQTGSDWKPLQRPEVLLERARAWLPRASVCLVVDWCPTVLIMLLFIRSWI